MEVEPPTFPIRTADLAPRTCAQCRESKKKCDKNLPKCARCARLALDCHYGESDNPHSTAPSLGTPNSESKLDEILRRLDRIESRQYAQFPVTPGSSTPSPQTLPFRSFPETSKPDTGPDLGSGSVPNPPAPTPGPLNCQINPGLMRPSYWNFITVMNVIQTLLQENTTARQIAQSYTSTIHTWLPLVPMDDLARKVVDFGNMNCSPQFAVLLLAMYGLVEKKRGVDKAPEESNVYLLSKHLFVVTLAILGPTWDLVHAGILVALFEHMHGIAEKPRMTIGTVMTMLSLLVEEESRGDGGPRVPAEEVKRTWWAAAIVDRYINPLPTDPSGRFLISYGDITGLAATEPNGIYSHHTTPELQQPSTREPWKSLPTEPTLAGESRAAQLLGEVQQFIHRAEQSLDMDCHEWQGFQEKVAAVLAGLRDIEYCPLHNDSHGGQWTCLSAVLLFYSFCYQKSVHCGLDEIFSTITVCFKEAIELANDRANRFVQSPRSLNLNCHEVSPSMIAAMSWGALGESLLEQRGELSHGARSQCRDLLTTLTGDWGMAEHRLTWLGLPLLPIYQLLQKG